MNREEARHGILSKKVCWNVCLNNCHLRSQSISTQPKMQSMSCAHLWTRCLVQDQIKTEIGVWANFYTSFDRGHLFKFQISCLHFTYSLLSNSFCMSPQSVTQFLPSGASAWSWEAAGHEHSSQIQPRWDWSPERGISLLAGVVPLKEKKNKVKKRKKGKEKKEKSSQIGGQMLITFTCKGPLISLPSAKLVNKI